MPIDEYVARDLLAWYEVTPYKKPTDYVWATDAKRAGAKRGKQPVWLSTVMRDHIQPVAQKLGIDKKLPWHTFRHTFSSILEANGEDVKVVRELLRHATSRMGMDTPVAHVRVPMRTARPCRWFGAGRQNRIQGLAVPIDLRTSPLPSFGRVYSHVGGELFQSLDEGSYCACGATTRNIACCRMSTLRAFRSAGLYVLPFPSNPRHPLSACGLWRCACILMYTPSARVRQRSLSPCSRNRWS